MGCLRWSPDLTLQRESLLELGLDLRPRLRAPALVQHRTQDAIDAEPGAVRHFPGMGSLAANGRKRRDREVRAGKRNGSPRSRCRTRHGLTRGPVAPQDWSLDGERGRAGSY